ncbi:spermidine synthase [Saccharothrix coeruleofusca]|uniref:Polyamine aminopropyltransferase n=1 Tax=Saccharothrix coeruleofusca TaxID=33919 RepID=A0A918AKQ6_9PSEU|nr:spermidine synthase [Saccharothrix coeruleofusca]MBP2338234.1 spermidine synthase [Saccharothrix coeruleofusca]GGP49831.1 polyamine aminopropyltransferase [Saccharothrix coeruleofusca]
MIREPLAAGLTRHWDVEEVVVDTNTAFQHLVIARTAQGLSLFCDDDRQSTEFSQLTYHEALMVPALLLADRVDRVLVIGSSEGVVCQMAVAAGASVVDHVDIDEQAVKLCAEHLPYGYTLDELALAEKGEGPIRVRYTDGWEYIRTTAERYDIVLVDLPDEREEEAQHNRLYGEEFLRMCKALLTPGGVVVTQAGCQTMWRNSTLIRSWQRFNAVFDTVAYYGSDEHEWAYLFGRADEVANPAALMAERLPALGYRPETIDDLALRGNTIPPYQVRHSPA